RRPRRGARRDVNPRRACIVGVGETAYAKWGGIADASEYALAVDAVLGAVADAGVSVGEVDGLSSFAEDRNEATFMAADLGIDELRYAAMSWLPGGGGACAAVANAAMAVETGQAEVVVVYRSLCQGQFRRFGRGPGNAAGGPTGPAARASGRTPGVRRARSLLEAHVAFTMPFGMFGPPIAYAMVTRRHMHRFGTTVEQLGAVAVTTRAHAARNPRAVMGTKPMSMEDYFASRPVADPFRLFDCCLETDGACAVVVTTAERARDLRQQSVEIVSSAQGTLRGFGHGQYSNVSMPDDDYASAGARQVAGRLWGRAGIGPEDVDVAQIYDHFTGLVLCSLEDFGFCARGEGGPFAASGALAWPGGAMPMNTHGGSLSEAYVHGLNHVVEGVRQLRGESTCQVTGAETCLVTSAAGVPTSALVLGR
ncbi:MAG: thiolase C-terminal domain-containing protein, partial [Acidimicrobiales bacterium]